MYALARTHHIGQLIGRLRGVEIADPRQLVCIVRTGRRVKGDDIEIGTGVRFG